MNAEQWNHALIELRVEPTLAGTWAPVFADNMPRMGRKSQAHFVSQVLHESGGLRWLEENLSYSAERLTAVWPKRFPNADRARPYARNPEKLANYVYAGRMGNSEPGDGWAFRGRGLIQITGRSNYTLVQDLTGMPVIETPDMLAEPEPAMLSALAWWGESVPDAESLSVEQVTRRVNGGLNGLADRQRLFDVALRVLGGDE